MALDGCQFIQNNEIYYCSAREGFTGMKWFKSEKINNGWTVGEYDEKISNLVEGELHISKNTLYFNASNLEGSGKTARHIKIFSEKEFEEKNIVKLIKMINNKAGIPK